MKRLALLLITIMILTGCSTTPQQQNIALTVITSHDIAADYDANAIAADMKYKGKMVAVRGIVDDLGTDIAGSPFVSLKTVNLITKEYAFMGGNVSKEVPGDSTIWNDFHHVICYFASNELNKLALASLTKKGWPETVTIVGTCENYIMGNVIINRCQIIK